MIPYNPSQIPPIEATFASPIPIVEIPLQYFINLLQITINKKTKIEATILSIKIILFFLNPINIV